MDNAWTNHLKIISNNDIGLRQQSLRFQTSTPEMAWLHLNSNIHQGFSSLGFWAVTEIVAKSLSTARLAGRILECSELWVTDR